MKISKLIIKRSITILLICVAIGVPIFFWLRPPKFNPQKNTLIHVSFFEVPGRGFVEYDITDLIEIEKICQLLNDSKPTFEKINFAKSGSNISLYFNHISGGFSLYSVGGGGLQWNDRLYRINPDMGSQLVELLTNY